MIQLKQSDIATTSANVIPIASTAIHSTLAASLAPTNPMPTSQPVSIESTPAIGTSREEATKLVKSMEDMSIQATEMNKLKEKVVSLETDYKLAKTMHKEEV